MIFLSPELRLSFEEEKARYETHNNDLRQEGYRKFLNQMWIPLREKLLQGFSIEARGLDFGCGPTEAFSQLAAEDGFEVQSYDPYFSPNDELLLKTYDFVWCSEVFEHFNRPSKSISMLRPLLRPGSILAVMTSQPPGHSEDFKVWGYHNDPTHISFYSDQCMDWIAKRFEWERHSIGSKINLFKAV